MYSLAVNLPIYRRYALHIHFIAIEIGIVRWGAGN